MKVSELMDILKECDPDHTVNVGMSSQWHTANAERVIMPSGVGYQVVIEADDE